MNPLITAQLLWQLSTGLQAPESSHYDHASKMIYVSNVVGDPTTKDGQGYISRVTLDGQMESPRWVEGLHAPKGIRIHQGFLWVSDIDRVARISINDPKKIDFIEIPGSKFLNDVAIDSSGLVYVSDMVSDHIHVIDQSMKPKLFLEGADLESPNGLLVLGKTLLIAGWGPGVKSDFSTKGPGGLFGFDTKTKRRVTRFKELGHLDGLESAGRFQGFFVSDWMAGKVYKTDKAPHVLIEGLNGAADIGFIPQKNILLVPEMNANRVNAYTISLEKTANRSR